MNAPTFSSTGFLIGEYSSYPDNISDVNYKNKWYPVSGINFSNSGDGQITSICIENECGPLRQVLFQDKSFQGSFKATSACSKKPSDYLELTKQAAIKKCTDFLNEKLEPADLSLFSCPISCIKEKCDDGGIFSNKKQVVCTSETKYNPN